LTSPSTAARGIATWPYPPAVVEALLAASSKGAFFNRHIRSHFRYQRQA
jgi:hypothetical protein